MRYAPLLPSPTLTPTDPVPRGLLTLCPGLHIYVCMRGFGCHGGCGCLGYRVCAAVASAVPVTLRALASDLSRARMRARMCTRHTHPHTRRRAQTWAVGDCARQGVGCSSVFHVRRLFFCLSCSPSVLDVALLSLPSIFVLDTRALSKAASACPARATVASAAP